MNFKAIFIAVFAIGIIFISCSTQQVLLDPKSFHKNQSISIETSGGEKVSGTVVLANSQALLMHDTYGNERGFLTKNIISAKGPEPVFDDNNIIVSEVEIDSMHTNTEAIRWN